MDGPARVTYKMVLAGFSLQDWEGLILWGDFLVGWHQHGSGPRNAFSHLLRCRHTVCREGACLEELHNAEAMPFGRHPEGWVQIIPAMLILLMLPILILRPSFSNIQRSSNRPCRRVTYLVTRPNHLSSSSAFHHAEASIFSFGSQIAISVFFGSTRSGPTFCSARPDQWVPSPISRADDERKTVYLTLLWPKAW